MPNKTVEAFKEATDLCKERRVDMIEELVSMILPDVLKVPAVVECYGRDGVESILFYELVAKSDKFIINAIENFLSCVVRLGTIQFGLDINDYATIYVVLNEYKNTPKCLIAELDL